MSHSDDPLNPDFSNTAVLVVDDEEAVRETLAGILEHSGFQVSTAWDGNKALELAGKTKFDVAIVDQSMPGMTGTETTKEIKRLSPDLEVIILTGHPSLESSLEAIQQHVFDYLCKPVTRQQIIRSVQRAAERRSLILQNRSLVEQLQTERNGFKKRAVAAEQTLDHHLATMNCFTGNSELIVNIRRQVAEVAPTDMTVLLRGESGTGKDVVARLVNELSGRQKTGDFVKINCPAIPETLLESELFGHEPGAFTGAERRKPGRMELAAGGTIFLDEIGELPLSLQTKLLQVIEQKEFTRLGGTVTIRVNARIIAATNAPLEKMIASGQFRPDLFYRLNEYTLILPALRERAEDIPLLVEHFISKHGEKYGRQNIEVAPDTMAQLIRYPWPGNVRELEGVIRRYVLTGRQDTILESLDNQYTQSAAAAPADTAAESLDEAEAQAILSALNLCHWNRRQAAKHLGISYSSLRRRIAKHNLKERSQPFLDPQASPPS